MGAAVALWCMPFIYAFFIAYLLRKSLEDEWVEYLLKAKPSLLNWSGWAPDLETFREMCKHYQDRQYNEEESSDEDFGA